MWLWVMERKKKVCVVAGFVIRLLFWVVLIAVTTT